MALKLRLARYGQKKRPFYRIVVAERLGRRDGRFVEIVGTYNPMTDPSTTVLKEDRVRHWINMGARPTLVTRALIEKQLPGLVVDAENRKRAKLQEARKARKARVKQAA